LTDVEDEFLGYNHTSLGHRVALMWHLPETVSEVMLHHHCAEGSTLAPKQVACVELANVLCSLKGVSSVGVRLVELRKPAMELLDLDGAGLKELTSKMEAELGLHEDLMALPTAG
jgi:HD-like signal output (HDOD) protein